ncbi:MAG TPA: tRNA (uridine(34)/cytosine(34)/5-carboxymethylaminomethyluridine(34)-2'-O)-methyltransferase TrmL [Clostridiales bacterium]|nr:tRNA (uridine(34)/cytosine(34)/5-carboxymethylaminomethyluridine(34)-2'-O)-methyltransferase TrmL [Clostridiales bacterium]HBJ97561.1 tRNA (uridine(34)/cytosine(34)/5-carboxymethylaminomethyluridine(34)-2'-O)-methyltransferase TrmL [Clostridiales bacterium]
MINIVLVEPEIPQNTGNIIRTCAATDSVLHIVKPIGFDLSDKHLKRAGLDYWSYADFRFYDSFDELREKFPSSTFYFFSTKGKKVYTEPKYKDGDFLVFGKETMGLPEPLLEKNYDTTVRLPMKDKLRSLNLSNTVAVAVYEALRQQDFNDLKLEGELTGRGY